MKKCLLVLTLLPIFLFPNVLCAQYTVTIGSESTSSYYAPVYISVVSSSFRYSNTIALYTAAEVGVDGQIIELAWNKADNIGYTAGDAVINIYMKEVSFDSVPAIPGTYAAELVGATLVYSSSTQSIPASTGWVNFSLTNPFLYSGSGNLMILIDWYRPSSPTDNFPRWYYSESPGMAATWTGSTSPPQYDYGSGYTRPNIQMTFNPSLADDAGITQVVSPVSPIAPGNSDVKVHLHNYGLATLNSTTIGWAINGVAQPVYSWTGNLASASMVSNVTIGNFNFPVGTHEITAWTSLPNGNTDSAAFNDTASTSVICAVSLNGVYTIGGNSPDYATIGAALADLNAAGVSGPVTFNISSGTYIEQMTLGTILGASPTNSVTFQSASGIAADVTIEHNASGSGDNWTVLFDDADYVTLQNLTLVADDSTNARVVVMNGNSEYNTITNCVIISQPEARSNSHSAGIYGSSSGNNYNSYTSNEIRNGYYGIYLYGSSSSLEEGTIIEGNMIQDYYYYGMYLSYHNAAIINSNAVQNHSSSGYVYGIYLSHCDNDNEVTMNAIHIDGSSSHYGLRIYYCDATDTTKGIVANNEISITGTSTSYNYGLYVYNSEYQMCYHNSVNLEAGNASSRAGNYFKGEGNYSINNIFVNTAGGYAFYVADNSLQLTDYNNLYATGSNLAYWNGDLPTLTDLQAASAQDMNSVNLDPEFASDDFLYPQSAAMDDLGTPLLQVPDDITGMIRSTVTPDIGCYEYSPPMDVGVAEIVSPEPYTFFCGNDTLDIVLVLQNYESPTDSIPVVVSIVAPDLTSQSLNGVYTAALDTSASDTLQLGSFVPTIPGDYEIYARTNLPGDTMLLNDSAVGIISIIPPIGSFPFIHDFGDSSISYFKLEDEAQSDIAINNIQGNPTPALHFTGGNSSGFTGSSSTTTPHNAWIDNLTHQASAASCNVDATGLNGLKLAFDLKMEYSYGAGYSWFRVLLNDSIQLSDLSGTSNFNPATPTADPFTRVEFDLTPYISEPFRITFQSCLKYAYGTGTTNGDNVYLDNIRFYRPSPNDVGISSIIYPADSGCAGTAIDIVVELNNFGSVVQDSVPVSVMVTSPGSAVQTISTIFSDSLFTGPSISFNVGTISALTSGTYTITAWTELPGDANLMNDTATSSFSTIMTVIDTFPLTEDFETFITGVPGTFRNGWVNVPATGYRFQVNTGQTGSGSTGPAVDHTLETSASGIYVYAEASSGSEGDEAYLVSPCLDMDQMAYPELSFWYHMTGSDIGILAVDVLDGGMWTEILSINGQQQSTVYDPWREASIPLVAYRSADKIRIRTVRGNGYAGDIGLDDIEIKQLIPLDAELLGFTSPVQGCNLENEPVSILIVNEGSQAIHGNMQLFVQVEGSTGPLSEAVTDSILPGDTLEYTMSTTIDLQVSNDSTFRMYAYLVLTGDTNQSNDTAYHSVGSFITPPIPAVEDTNILFGGSASLFDPDMAPARSLVWYDSPGGTNVIALGDTFITPQLFATTSYWVAAANDMQVQGMLFGPGLAVNQYVPCSGWYDYGWSKTIYTADELLFSGIIDTISFFVQNTPDPNPYVMPGQKIWLGHTSAQEFADANSPDTTSLIKVFEGDIGWMGPGEVKIPLDQIFTYNGSSNLILYYENWDGDYLIGGPSFRATGISQDQCAYNIQDNSFPYNSGSFITSKPDMGLYGTLISNEGVCLSERDSAIVYVSPPALMIDDSIHIDLYGCSNTTGMAISLGTSGTGQFQYTISGQAISDSLIQGISPVSGIISAGDDLGLLLDLDPADFPVGITMSDLLIQTNNPVNPDYSVVLSIEQHNGPMLALSDTTINFGSIDVYRNLDTALMLENTGVGLLDLQISNTLPEFRVGVNQLSLGPCREHTVRISFNPVSAGIFRDTILIQFPAGMREVHLEGIGLIDTMSVAFAASPLDSLDSRPPQVDLQNFDSGGIFHSCGPDYLLEYSIVDDNIQDDSISLFLSVDSGITFTNIARSLPDTGPAAFSFSPYHGSHALLYLQAVDEYGNTDSDTCDQFFELLFYPFNVYSLTGGGAYCEGGQGVAVGLSASDTAVQYQVFHEGSAVSQPVTGDGNAIDFGNFQAAGHYSVVASVMGGACSLSMAGTVEIQVIPAPLVDLGGDRVLPAGYPLTISPSVSGATGPFIYRWLPGTLFTDSTAQTGQLNPLYSSQNVSLEVTDSTTACSSTSHIQIQVNPHLSIRVDPDSAIRCQGDSLSMNVIASNGSENYSYNWYNAGGTSLSTDASYTAYPTSSSWYRVVVSDGYVSLSDTLNVTVPAVPDHITLSRATIQFDTLLKWNLHEDTINIKNTGCLELTVQDVQQGLPELTISPAQFSLSPGQSRDLHLAFNALDVGWNLDTLHFISNSGYLNALEVPVTAYVKQAVLDFSIEDSAYADPSPAVDSETISLHFNIFYEGETDADGLSYLIKNDSLGLSYSHLVDHPFVSGTAYGEAFAIPEKLSAGNYRWVVQLDPSDQMIESDENNNSDTIDVLVQTPAEFIASDLSLQDTSVTLGETLHGSFTFENTGQTGTSVHVRILAESILGNEYSLFNGAVQADGGSVVDVDFSYTPLDLPGLHYIRAEVNDDRAVSEEVYSDNSLEEIFTALLPVPLIGISGPSNHMAGDTVAYSISILNSGLIDIENLALHLDLSGVFELIHSSPAASSAKNFMWNLGNLAGQAQTTINLSLKFKQGTGLEGSMAILLATLDFELPGSTLVYETDNSFTVQLGSDLRPPQLNLQLSSTYSKGDSLILQLGSNEPLSQAQWFLRNALGVNYLSGQMSGGPSDWSTMLNSLGSLAEGSYKVVAEGVDLNANPASVQQQLVIDRSSPVIAITGPDYVTHGVSYFSLTTNEILKSTPQVQVSPTQSKNIQASLLRQSGNEYMYKLSVDDTVSAVSLTLDVTAEDRAGNTTSASATLAADFIAPQFTHDIPARLQEGTTTVQITASEVLQDIPDIMIVDALGRSLPYYGPFKASGLDYTMIILVNDNVASGEVDIHISGTDLAGNKGELELLSSVDNSGPQLTIVTDPVVPSANYNVKIYTDEPVQTPMTISMRGNSPGEVYTAPAPTWSTDHYEFAMYNSPLSSITVEATDTLGQSAIKTKAFIDLEIPQLTFTFSDQPKGTNPVYVGVPVRNNSGVPLEGVPLVLYDGYAAAGVQIGDTTYVDIGAYGLEYATVLWPISSQRDGYHLTAVVNPDFKLSETNMGNNTRFHKRFNPLITSEKWVFQEGIDDTLSVSARFVNSHGSARYLTSNDIQTTAMLLDESGDTLLESLQTHTDVDEFTYYTNAATLQDTGSYKFVIIANDTSGLGPIKDTFNFKYIAPLIISVNTDSVLYHRNSLVDISGTLTEGTEPVIHQDVIVYIRSEMGTRTYPVTTDSLGNYSKTFDPFDVEAGKYKVSAMSLVNDLKIEVTTDFEMLGLLLDPGIVTARLSRNSNLQAYLTLQNVGDSMIQSINVQITDTVNDGITVSIGNYNQSLSPGNSLQIPVSITAAPGPSVEVTYPVLITSAEGETERGGIRIKAEDALPRVEASGYQRVILNELDLEEVKLWFTNTGWKTLYDPVVSITGIPFAQVLNNSADRIDIGDTMNCTMLFSADSVYATGYYPGTITLSSTNHPDVSVNVDAFITDNEHGNLLVTIDNTVNAPVPNSTVYLYSQDFDPNSYSYPQYTLVSNDSGQVVFDSVPAGIYQYKIIAEKHKTKTGQIVITPVVDDPKGNGIQELAVKLNLDLITYTWNVTSTTLADEYDIHLEVLVDTLENGLYPPVLRVSPYIIKHTFLDDITYTGQFTIRNQGQFTVINIQPVKDSYTIYSKSGEALYFVEYLYKEPILDLGLEPGASGTVVYSVKRLFDGYYENSVRTWEAPWQDMKMRFVGEYTVSGYFNYTECFVDFDLKRGSHPCLQVEPEIIHRESRNGFLDNDRSTLSLTLTNPNTNILHIAHVDLGVGYFLDNKHIGINSLFDTLSTDDMVDELTSNMNFSLGLTSTLERLTGGPLGWPDARDISGVALPGSPSTSYISWRTPPRWNFAASDDGLVRTYRGLLFLRYDCSFENRTRLRILRMTGVDYPSWSHSLPGGGFVLVYPGGGSGSYSGGGSSGSSSGGGGIPQPISVGEGDGWADLRLYIDQKLNLERQAFNAELKLQNNTSYDISNFAVNVILKDEYGQVISGNQNSVNDILFFGDPVLSGINDISGNGNISANSVMSIKWLIIPKPGAGGYIGKTYFLQAHFTYHVNDTTIQVYTLDEEIEVQPMPLLDVIYTIPRIFKPDIPFFISSTISNNGEGPANDVSLTTSQPRMECLAGPNACTGLTTKINGGYLEDQFLSRDMTINYGEVPAKSNRVGYWVLNSNYLGIVTGFSANWEHAESLGGQQTSLLNSVQTHYHTRIIRYSDIQQKIQAKNAVNKGKETLRRFIVADSTGDSIPDYVLGAYSGKYRNIAVLTNQVIHPATFAESYTTIRLSNQPGWIYTMVNRAFGEAKVIEQVSNNAGLILDESQYWVEDEQIHIIDNAIQSSAYTITYRDPLPPDLGLFAREEMFDPDHPTLSDTMIFTPGIANLGDYDAESVYVSAYRIMKGKDGDSMVFIQQRMLQQLSSATSSELSFSIPPASLDPGWNQLLFVINPDTVFGDNYPGNDSLLADVFQNTYPLITSDSVVTAEQDLLYHYQAMADDPNLGYGDTLTYSLDAAPAWLQVDPVTGLLSGTPAISDVGTQQVILRVSDAFDGFDQQAFNIEVLPHNSMIVLEQPLPDVMVYYCDTQKILVSCLEDHFNDPDNPLSYSLVLSGDIPDSVFVDSSGVNTSIVMIPGSGFTDTLNLTVTAYNNKGQQLSDSMMVWFVPLLKPTAGIVSDTLLCDADKLNLTALANNFEQLNWYTSGDGNLSLNTGLQTVYDPGNQDIINGNVQIILGAERLSVCPIEVFDTLRIDLLVSPLLYSLSGGGIYCPPDSGLVYSLSGSEPNTHYVLLLNDSTIIHELIGTGSALSYPPQTATGNFTIEAIRDYSSRSCTRIMSGISVAHTPDSVSVLTPLLEEDAAFGGYADFSLMAEHVYSMQWEMSTNGGLNYLPVSDSGVYSGTQSPHLEIGWADSLMDGYLFRCRLLDTCGNTSFAGPVVLNVCDTCIAVRMKVFLQGAYTGNSSMRTDLSNLLPAQQPYSGPPWNYFGDENITASFSNAVDWILVRLLDSNLNVIQSSAGVLMNDGSIINANGDPGMRFDGVYPGQYRIMVDHRNHMPVITQDLLNVPDTQLYDLSDTMAISFMGGSAHTTISIDSDISALIGGDISKDNELKYAGAGNDRSYVFMQLIQATGSTAINATASGYFSGDVNLSGVLKYTGAGNDPSLIIQNLINLTGSSAITSFYTSPTPKVIEFKCGDSLKDLRDGKVYSTKLVQGVCWMNDPLQYQASSGGKDTALIAGLYQWDDLIRAVNVSGSICPSGWGLPTDKELQTYTAKERAGYILWTLEELNRRSGAPPGIKSFPAGVRCIRKTNTNR